MTDKKHVDDWFSVRRLGLFMHFGLYAIEGWHEQDQMRRRISRAEYEKLITRFNPESFDAHAIIDLAESVGMEYVCLTTKHHDGFCLWDTKQTDFNVMRSPYGMDIVGKLADACHERDFALGLYYSVVDWHHPNYPNQGRHHELAKPEPGDNPDWDRYLDYLRAQVRELCSQYGEIRHFFWDMNVPEHKDPTINNMLRELQPNMVINNRGFDEGDFGTPEREYQKNENERLIMFDRPTEACNSVGTQSWGYRKDEDYYSSVFLIQSIDAMMAKGANYLLNVGPNADGKMPQTAVDILSDIGDWYKRTRESFSDTQPATELTTNSDVLLTRRENDIYIHLSQPIRSEAVLLPPFNETPSLATLLNTGDSLECSVGVVPVYWKKNTSVLIIKGIKRELLNSAETLVIKLSFENGLPCSGSDIKEFQG